MNEDFETSVTQLVAMIPAGSVLSYGDIAELLDCGGPRQVGKVMSGTEGDLPWWRVVRADGQPPACHGNTAFHHYRTENTPIRSAAAASGAERILMKDARWQPTESEWEQLDVLKKGLAGESSTAGNSKMSDQDDSLFP
ncbi:MGMT family protein [Arthrobacter roseus]|uniref:MGMT family protein n=1 Tax=Arthrobacter roseus TaxID=136274 RepID=UPI0030842454|nr:alkylated DNA nucleotide flippase Atl1 [Arthrobacter roseus]